MKNTFGNLLRRQRTAAGKTMGDLARHLGVSVTYVSDVERGYRAPLTRANIIKTADFLGIGPSPLLIAAAERQGAFALDADVGPRARAVGAALMRSWSGLSDQDLEEIAKILDRKEKG